MTLDRLLLEMKEKRLILVSPEEGCWPSPLLTPAIKKALKQHRAGLRLLMKWADVRTCASPTWHRKYWKYCGGQRYICEVCQVLSKWIA